MANKQLAIMRDVGFGLRDVGTPCVWFTAHDGIFASLQILTGKEIEKLLIDSKVHNIKDLEGSPCWIEKLGNSSKFIGVANV